MAKNRGHVDDWILHEDIRSTPAVFRSIQEPTEWVRVVLRGLPAKTEFAGPTLFAAVETARLAHRDLHGSRAPSIYDLHSGVYHWWDETTSRAPHALPDKARLYLSQLYAIPPRNVQISYSHSAL